VLVGRPGEHARAQPREQYVRGFRQILRDLLLDRTALLFPLGRRVEHRAHAQCLDVQRDVEILGRHREQVLREIFAGIGVEVAADQAADVGELNGSEPRAAAEHHVLLSVRRARKPRRRLV